MKSLKSIFILIFSFLIVAWITYYFSNLYFDNRMNDFVVRMTTSTPANKDTVLVIIDDKSISKIRFPWKRSLYTDMFEFLQNTAKAKLVIFDALVVSPDNNNPKSDADFIKRIKKLDRLLSGFDVHFSFDNDDILSSEYMPLFDSKFKDIHIKTSEQFDKMPSYRGVTNFMIPYLKNINTLGAISANGDVDGVMRIFTPVVKIQDKIYPSLALITYSKITGHKDFVLKDKYLCTDDNCKSLKMPIKYGSTTYPMSIFGYTKWYRALNSNYTHKTYSAIDVVDSFNLVKEGKKPIIDPNEFKDKIVFVGANANAHALQDVKSTVILSTQSGTDCIATFLDNLLNNQFSQRTTQGQNILILLALSFIIFILILNFSLIVSSLSCACLALGYFLIYFQLMRHDFIIPIVTTFLIMVIAMLFGYSYRFIIEDTKKKKIQKAMGMYISNDIMKNVVKNIDDVKLGGKRAELSILFADIRGFTSISEKLQPEEVTDILNEYFSEMEPIISKYKGVLNKFIGDAVLVIFGDPIYDKDHALNAVRCADHMLKRVKYLQEKWILEGKPKIEIGVGINTGEAFVGNIGSQNRLEYTVIGDAVNLASRIEGYNKVYKTRFLISHPTYLKVRSYVDVIKIKEVTIRGKAKKIDIYEVLRMNDEQ